jgi:transcriptional regulator with XRE-family HTH domain
MPQLRRATQTDKTVGQRIRALRIRAGKSQTELGADLAISFQQIQKYENGVNRVAPGRLAVIARVLGVSIATLFGEDHRGAAIEIELQLNTHTRRELIATLDKIKSPRFESVLLALAMECANGNCGMSNRRK